MEEQPPSDSPAGRVGLPIVIARILIVSGIGFASAIGLFLLVGGVWQVGLISLAFTFVFIFLMFFLEWTTEVKS